MPTYNWTDFFASKMKKVNGIKMFHQFHFSSSEPVVVVVKEHSDSPTQEINILKNPWVPCPSDLHSTVPPKQMSAERKWYLYDQIRPFCPADDQDTTCPIPDVPKLSSMCGTPVPQSSSLSLATPCADSADGHDSTPSKRRRLCTICRKEGHNSRSCQDNTMCK